MPLSTLKFLFIVLLFPIALMGQQRSKTKADSDSVTYKISQLDKIFSSDTINILAVTTGDGHSERNHFYFYRSAGSVRIECVSTRPYDVKTSRVCEHLKEMDLKKLEKLKALLVRGIRLDSDLFGCSTRKDFTVWSASGTVYFKDLVCSPDDIWKPLNSLIKLKCSN